MEHVASDRAPAAVGWRRRLAPVAREGVVALAVGLLVGSLARDRVVPTAVLHGGIAPLGMLLLGAGFLAVARRRWPARSAIVAAAMVVALFRIVAIDCGWPGPSGEVVAAREPLRVVHWNIGHGVFRLGHIGEVLAGDAPDVLLVTEPPRIPREALADALGMPGAAVHANRHMALLSRLPFRIEGDPPAARGLRCFVARFDTSGGRSFDVVATDMWSDPLVSRAPALGALAAWVAARRARDGEGALIALGDFNTPRDSILLDPLRAELAHAYETAGGGGWPYSWPLPLPMLSIDHAFVSPSVRVVRYRLRAAACSDHLRQVIDLDLARSERQGSG